MNKTMLRTAAAVAALALLGAGCNPFARVQDRISDRIGEEIGERLLEGSVGGGTDLELGKIPADFPSDVPRYPGAEILSAVITNEGRIAIMNFKTGDSAEAVVEWYGDQLVSAGFESDADIAKLGLFRVYTKGEVKITIQTQRIPNENKTAVTVTRAEEKQR